MSDPSNPPKNSFSTDLSPENPEEEKSTVQISEGQFILYEKIITILNAENICLECLGRQFSYLGTGTDNTTRAQSLLLGILMECDLLLGKTTSVQRYQVFKLSPLIIIKLIADRTNFEPAIKLLLSYTEERQDLFIIEEVSELSNEIVEKYSKQKKSQLKDGFKCHLCQNLLIPDSIVNIAEKIVESARVYEFESFLLGTNVPPLIINTEEEFRARFDLQNGEAFKANMNRLVGKQLHTWWAKPVDFKNPDVNFIINLNNNPFSIDIIPSALYIRGSYLKFVRNLPQTRWDCFECHGTKLDFHTKEPCKVCHGTGVVMEGSIEELIFPYLLDETLGISAIFHGAGREDFDVRCFGTGRPFVIEIKNPHRRYLDLENIRQKINIEQKTKINLPYLLPGTHEHVTTYKEHIGHGLKMYHALVYLADFIDRDTFIEKFNLLKEKIVGKKLYQRTPLRVVRRRADLTREKIIHNLEGKYIDPVHFFCKIQADGGTYIKELISGDQGRTNPSFASIFNIPMICVELDVVEIEDPFKNMLPLTPKQ